MIVLLLAGCRSLSERSYTTKTADSDERVQQGQGGYCFLGEMAGQLAACLVNGHADPNHSR